MAEHCHGARVHSLLLKQPGNAEWHSRLPLIPVCRLSAQAHGASWVAELLQCWLQLSPWVQVKGCLCSSAAFPCPSSVLFSAVFSIFARMIAGAVQMGMGIWRAGLCSCSSSSWLLLQALFFAPEHLSRGKVGRKTGECVALQPCSYAVSSERCRIRPKGSSSASVSWPCSTN